jgi:hypothetical protein
MKIITEAINAMPTHNKILVTICVIVGVALLTLAVSFCDDQSLVFLSGISSALLGIAGFVFGSSIK